MSNGTPAAQTTATGAASTSRWQDHPAAITVAALAGAAVVAGLLYLAAAFLDTGDEPPIRVNNGSIDLQLATHHHSWAQDQDARHWHISWFLHARSKDDLDVVIAVNPSAVLPGAVCSASGRGKRVTVNYADGQKTGSIDIESAGQHSSIRSNTDDLTRTDDHHLAYGSNDVFITSIVLDGQPLCTFTDKSQLAALVILDYPK